MVSDAPGPAGPTPPAARDLPEGAEPTVPDRTGTVDVTDVGRLVRLAAMARMLLYEANTVELDEGARHRLADVYHRSVTALTELLSDELRDELVDLQPLLSGDELPTASELRVAQAQLVGWLEGVFQGVRVTLLTQQLASQDQLAQFYSEAMQQARRDQERGFRAPYL
jgi:hypothetical protein